MFRALLALAVGIALLSAPAMPSTAAQAVVATYDNPEFGIAFDYPDSWTLSTAEPRDVLANPLLSVQALGDPTTAFIVGAYRLEPAVTDENLDPVLEAQDQAVMAWVAGLPASMLIDITDITVDGLDGRLYEYEYDQDDRRLLAEMILLPHADQVVEITQLAALDDYNHNLDTFDEIFLSLRLPWSEPL